MESKALMDARPSAPPLDCTVSPFQYLKKNFCLYRYLNWDYVRIYVGYITVMEGHKKICVSHYYIKSPHPLGISICYKNPNRFHFQR